MSVSGVKLPPKKKLTMLQKAQSISGIHPSPANPFARGVVMPTNSPSKVTIEATLALNPGEKDSVTIEAHDDPNPFLEVFKSPESIPREGRIGALVFAKGIAYIRTRGGIVNLGDAMEHADPIFFTEEQKFDKGNDRRAAIKAQKEKKNGTRS